MLDLNIPSKEHDESRQGEAIILETPKDNAGRKLYLKVMAAL